MDNSLFTDKGLLEMINMHIDWITVLLVVLGGLFAKKYLAKWRRFDNAIKTLIASSVVITVYILLLALNGSLQKADYTRYFISYCFATTMYELLLKKLLKMLGLDKQDKPDTDKPLPKA